jgi:hypothetical protein
VVSAFVGPLRGPLITLAYQLPDVDVALDRRAEENIVAHRDGPDGYPGGGDDDPFDTVDEPDAVPYVGRSALENLRAYATSCP